jgi:hypothetical protein
MRRAVPVLGRRERDARRRMRLVSRKPRTAEIEGCTPTNQNACPEGDPDIIPSFRPRPLLQMRHSVICITDLLTID